MKPSISVAAYKTKFGPVVYNEEENYLQLFNKLVDIGYKGIDLFINKKTDKELEIIKDALVKSGLEISMLIFIYLSEMGVNFSQKNEKGSVEVAKKYVREMSVANFLNAKTMPLGLIRGRK